MVKQTVSSGTVWEELAGYSRAVRIGDRILVSGTTATGPEGLVGGDDAGGADGISSLTRSRRRSSNSADSLRDVVRTRVFVSDMTQWEAVARVHGERFGDIRPVNTLVQAKLVGEQYLVEIEAEAVIGAGDAV